VCVGNFCFVSIPCIVFPPSSPTYCYFFSVYSSKSPGTPAPALPGFRSLMCVVFSFLVALCSRTYITRADFAAKPSAAFDRWGFLTHTVSPTLGFHGRLRSNSGAPKPAPPSPYFSAPARRFSSISPRFPPVSACTCQSRSSFRRTTRWAASSLFPAL